MNLQLCGFEWNAPESAGKRSTLHTSQYRTFD